MMSKIDALLIVYLRFFAKRYRGNYYEAKYNDYIIALLRILEIEWTRCKKNVNKVCFMWDRDCSEISDEILQLSSSSNEEVCRMILGISKDLFAVSEQEIHIIQTMFARMGYHVRFTGELKFVAVGKL